MEESSEKGGLGNGTIFALAFWLVTWTLLPRMSGIRSSKKEEQDLRYSDSNLHSDHRG